MALWTCGDPCSISDLLQYVLTAAHCIAWGKGALKLKLIMGDHDLRSKKDKARHVVRKVRPKMMHLFHETGTGH